MPQGGGDAAWLTLAMSATRAGNPTPPASPASVMVVERAKAHTRASFRDFFEVGTPSALLGPVVGAPRLRFVAY